MPIAKAQQSARDRSLEKFEEIRARVPKGRKEEIKKHAASNNESVNGFINRAISEAIARDSAKASPSQEAATEKGECPNE